MIVPQFWAEARVQQPRAAGRRQITVRRFGWSDVSEADAEALAQQRAQAAFQQIVSGARLHRLERKLAYNGAEGVPIREEIVARHGDAVITRNAYGAQCLNTPDVFFADVDFESRPARALVVLCFLGLLGADVAAAVVLKSAPVVFILAFLTLACFYPLALAVHALWIRLRGGAERTTLSRIEAFMRRRPDWNLRLYRTPAGFRLLAVHALFDPSSPDVAALFAELGVDRLYATMCRNQHCFRARLSAKPWRIGIQSHVRPRPGVWPVKPEHLEIRRTWVRNYEAAAAAFASCRFVGALGTGPVHPKAATVQDLHDRLAQALSQREIA